VTIILPLTGAQYSKEVIENCVAYWKAVGTYMDTEAIAVDKFKKAFMRYDLAADELAVGCWHRHGLTGMYASGRQHGAATAVVPLSSGGLELRRCLRPKAAAWSYDGDFEQWRQLQGTAAAVRAAEAAASIYGGRRRPAVEHIDD
jgi:hypothetical protein